MDTLLKYIEVSISSLLGSFTKMDLSSGTE